MICPRCHSNNVNVQAITVEKTTKRGCLGWFFWILFSMITSLWFLIIPVATNERTRSKIQNLAICQHCGHRWKI